MHCCSIRRRAARIPGLEYRALPGTRHRNGQRSHRGFPWRHVRLSLCRGNQRGRWLASGGYERIARTVFRRTRAQRFLLEYDDARSGSFEPLKEVPKDKLVVLGLITTKRPHLEPMDELASRIREASRFVPLERLAVSPQCGFSNSVMENAITPQTRNESSDWSWRPRGGFGAKTQHCFPHHDASDMRSRTPPRTPMIKPSNGSQNRNARRDQIGIAAPARPAPYSTS